MEKVNNRIREVRLEKKIPGTKVAKLLGISPQYYYDIEKGERNLSAELAVKISEILDVSVSYLLMEDEEDVELNKYNYDVRELNIDILGCLKLITDNEGYFFEDVQQEGFMAVAKNLHMAKAYFNASDHHFYAQQTIEFFENPDDYTKKQSETIINELREAYNYRTIKTVLDDNDTVNKSDFLEDIKKIIKRHEIKETPASCQTEKEFVDKLELTDEKILEEFNIQLDGKPLSKDEAKGVIAYLRSLRSIRK